MSKEIEEKLKRIPVINRLIGFLKRTPMPKLPELSLYDIAEMYVVGVLQGALSTRASAIAFSIFLALFPLIIFLVTLLPFVIPYVNVGEAAFDAQFLMFLESFLPTATGDYFSEVYQQLKDQKSGGILSSAFLVSIFLMANGVNSIFGGFENSYHIKLTRNFIKQYSYALMVGLILSVLLILGAVVYVYVEFYILREIGVLAARAGGYETGANDVTMARVGQALFFVLLSYFTTAILYYFGTAESKKARFFSYGATMTTILFLLTSYIFGFYVERISTYNELYGALGGLLILMVYIWLNSIILLLGFELNATINFLKRSVNPMSPDEDA